MAPEVRKGQGSTHLGKEEFTRRLQERFYDPRFEPLRAELQKIAEAAWSVYDEYHKSPRKQPAGTGFADPTFELPIEWLRARALIANAQRQQQDPTSPSRVLLIGGSARSDATCPGEMSKTFRLVKAAQDALQAASMQVDLPGE